MSLADYVLAHTERGVCTCGKCFDAPEHPEEKQPQGHTVDLTFFKVAIKQNAVLCPKCNIIMDWEYYEPTHGYQYTCLQCNDKIHRKNSKDEFLDIVQKEYPHWLDGKEHNYLNMGADIGDQGIALMTIGLGHLLGIWKALTPDTIMPFLPLDLKQKMAGQGMVLLQYST